MPNKKIKTLIILSPGFPANEDDSTCIPPQQIFVKALNAVNPDLNIIVLAFQYPFFSKEYKWHNIKVISFGHAGNGRGSRLFTAHRVWSVLKKLDKDYEIIGLLSFWLGKCALVGDKFAKKHQLKHYCWILGQDAKIGNKYFYKMKPEGDILIALSDFVVKEFNKNYYIRPQHIIPVGIDTTLFNASNNVRNIDVLGAGSLIPLKQYSIFVQLINELKIALPNIKAVICGDGQEIDKLQAMVRGMSLENNISFAGRLPHNEVLSLMQQSKTFVHTSSYEGFGAVCLEALYAGAHVVSFVQPMNAAIKNWHIAADKEHMKYLLTTILLDSKIEHTAVLPYTIEANAKAVLQLFNYNDIAI